MSNIHFYPRLTDSLIDKSGYRSREYIFTYRMAPDAQEIQLTLGKGKVSTLTDPNQTWNLGEDGLRLNKVVTFDYPTVLKGPNGVAPARASVLPCILWTNKKLDLTGVIRPSVDSKEPSLTCTFNHEFEAGAIAGDLQLDMILYLAESADALDEGEEILMNETGVNLGRLEEPLFIDIDGDVTNFPIEEFGEPDGPLWRMQFEPWEDPRDDLFSEASFTLLLNNKHPDCPKIANGAISNETLLREIIAQAYFLIYEKVREYEGAWEDMQKNSNLVPDSICSVLHWFSERDADKPFDWGTPEGRLLSIKRIVDLSFEVDDTNE